MRIGSKFIEKMKLAMYILVHGTNSHMRVMTCAKCGCVNIQEIPGSTLEGTSKDMDIDYYFEQHDKCLKCGAECREVQIWNY